jgi:hypothetical protein
MSNKTLVYNVYLADGDYSAARADSQRDVMARDLGFLFRGSISVPVGQMYPGTQEQWERHLEGYAINSFVMTEAGSI